MSLRAEKSISTSITILVIGEELVQELERKFPISLSVEEKIQKILEAVCTDARLQASLSAKLQASK